MLTNTNPRTAHGAQSHSYTRLSMTPVARGAPSTGYKNKEQETSRKHAETSDVSGSFPETSTHLVPLHYRASDHSAPHLPVSSRSPLEFPEESLDLHKRVRGSADIFWLLQTPKHDPGGHEPSDPAQAPLVPNRPGDPRQPPGESLEGPRRCGAAPCGTCRGGNTAKGSREAPLRSTGRPGR